MNPYVYETCCDVCGGPAVCTPHQLGASWNPAAHDDHPLSAQLDPRPVEQPQTPAGGARHQSRLPCLMLVHVDPGVCRHYIQERERELARREAADAETCRQAIQMLEFAAENVDALPAAAHEAGGAEGLHIEGLLDRSECEQRLTLWRERLERLEAS